MVSVSQYSSLPWIIHNCGSLYALKREYYRFTHPSLQSHSLSNNHFLCIPLQQGGQWKVAPHRPPVNTGLLLWLSHWSKCYPADFQGSTLLLCPPDYIWAFLYWLKQLVLNLFSLLHSSGCAGPRAPGQNGSGSYLPPNIDNDLFPFLFPPFKPTACFIIPVLECLSSLTQLTCVKLIPALSRLRHISPVLSGWVQL